jgi:hypothetical protein
MSPRLGVGAFISHKGEPLSTIRSKSVAAAVVAVFITGVFAPSAAAGGYYPDYPPPKEEKDKKDKKDKKKKCNAGRGNGSEGNPDCDPGNSGGNNQGGD